MLFNSWIFALFLGIVLAAYYSLDQRGQNVLLLVASYVFYGWWDWRFCGLLLLSTVVDSFAARLIHATEEEPKRFRYLMVSMVTNLGILGFFKYFDFFITSAVDALNVVGVEAHAPTLRVILPVGISFYTFQTMAYTIDVYRRLETPAKNPLDFALYVAYFPQLVAGPIERSTHLLPQIEAPRTLSAHQVWSGAQLVLMGLFKKIFIADSVAPWVNKVFASPDTMGRAELLLGIYLFALQIYGDFAGYTDIARGVSRWLGIELSLNFRQPYVASNITDFWRRWHMTLSSWLRDYLYIPLGGNRNGTLMTYRNNFLTMLLGGLWHGASWNFVVWGALHGGYLAAHKLWLGEKKVDPTPFPTGATSLLRWGVSAFATFHLVCLAWVFFRAPTLAASVAYLGGVAIGPNTGGDLLFVAQLAGTLVFFGAAATAVDVACWRSGAETPVPARWPAPVRGLVYAVMILLLTLVGEDEGAPFIYFQF